jgi:hypothetical protein
MPNGYKICENFPLNGLQKYIQIWIFCKRIYHLATMTHTHVIKAVNKKANKVNSEFLLRLEHWA